MTIVISFNISKQFALSKAYVNQFIVVVPFSLQGSEKRLCHGIVPTIAIFDFTLCVYADNRVERWNLSLESGWQG
jgi:hypothetical protein